MIRKVPIQNVGTALVHVPFEDLLYMVKSVSPKKLIQGLQIITVDEIKEIPPSKLKIVLEFGDMNTVRMLQNKYGSKQVITAMRGLDTYALKSLLVENNFDAICRAIEVIER